LLFELERQSEAAALDQAGKNLAQAKASHDLAESTYQRRKELRESPSAVVSAENSTGRGLTAIPPPRKSPRSQPPWTRPNGRLTRSSNPPDQRLCADTLYRQGEWVAAGNPVISLLPPENLKVRFFVPQEALPQIKIGAPAKVTFDAALKHISPR